MRRTQQTGHRGLVAALEAEEEVVAAQAVATTPIGDNVDSLETDLINVADLTSEGDADEAQMGEAAEIATALEGIAEALGISASNGGMDRYSAAAVDVAVSHLYKRVGLKKKSMPSMESFGQTSSRIGATQIAMEDIMEQVKKLWAAIVAAIQKAIEWAVAFFNSVFDASTKLKARAKTLAAKAEATSGKAKVADFESEKLVKALHVGNGVGDIAAHAKTISVMAKEGFGDTKNYTETLGEEVLADMVNPDTIKDIVEKFEMPAYVPMHGAKEVSNPESIGQAAVAEGIAVFRSAELPGGMAFIARAPKVAVKGQAAIDMVNSISTTIAPFDTKAAEPTAKTVAVLSTADAVAVAKAVEALADELLGYKAQQAKLTELKKKIASSANALGKKTDITDEEAAGIKAVQKIAGSIPKWIDSPAKEFARYSVNTGKALLDLVEESLKQYDTKPSKEPAAIAA